MLARVTRKFHRLNHQESAHGFTLIAVPRSPMHDEITLVLDAREIATRGAPLFLILCGRGPTPEPLGGPESRDYLEKATALLLGLVVSIRAEALASYAVESFNGARMRRVLDLPSNIDVLGILALGYDRTICDQREQLAAFPGANKQTA
jgi:hypothetical protein